MKRFQYKETGNFLILFLLTVLLVWLFVLRFGIFGAKVDWISQHSVLPDYFRRQFYETGKLFPEFAFNIGGGQNIYNFAYYGLFSPFVLFSCLLPFVKMPDYMMAVQFFCLEASVMFFYAWLRRRAFSRLISFCTAVIFLLSGPMIYHSYHQIMFVNYMPFLCMGLLGTDRYFEEQKQGKKCIGLLVISVFLMIMTSFYFSIGGMLALIIYGIYRYFENCGEKTGAFSFKSFLAEGVKFSVPFLLAVMLAGVLLVPAASALTGREGSVTGISAADLILPRISPERFFYSPYGIGLTTFGVTAPAAMLFSAKLHERVLSWSLTVILTVPVFAYLLNGGLYIRDKVMIPFLPLLCYMTACYIRTLTEERDAFRRRWTGFLPYLAPICVVCAGWLHKSSGKCYGFLFLDGAVMMFCFFLFQRTQKEKLFGKKGAWILLLPPIVFQSVVCMGTYTKESQAVEREFYRDVIDTDAEKLVRDVTENEKGFYRTEQLGTDEENAANLNRVRDMGQYLSSVYSSSYHKGYQAFRQNVFQTEEPFRNFLMQPPLYHPLYQDFMGIRYIVSEKELTGFRLIESRGKWKAYENEDALPIAYVTDRVIGEAEYKKLEFPYNQLALREYAAVEGSGSAKVSRHFSESGIESSVKEITVEFPEKISAEREKESAIYLPDTGAGTDERQGGGNAGQKVLFLQFHVENLKPSDDVTVYVAGIRNKLTSRKHFYYNGNTVFTYAALLEEGQTRVPVIFGKGEYELSDVKCFVGMLSEKSGVSQSEFQVDKEKTKGNVIAGNVEVKTPGYLVTSIPYDENFEIRVDGKRAAGERVNTAFLGFRTEKGEHEIQMIYHAPGVRTGKLLSLAGIFIIALMPAAGKLSGIIYSF